MCAPSYAQLRQAGWFDDERPRLVLSAQPERVLEEALSPFCPAVEDYLRTWFALASKKTAPRLSCSLDAIFPNQRFGERLLDILETDRFIDRRKLGEIAAPRALWSDSSHPEFASMSSSLKAICDRARGLIAGRPVAERPMLLDDLKAWTSRALRGLQVSHIARATEILFEREEPRFNDAVLGLLIAAEQVGFRTCITSSMNVWAARWIVAEKLNPMLDHMCAPAVPLSNVGGIPSRIQVDGGCELSDDGLSSSLANWTTWNPSMVGRLSLIDGAAETSAPPSKDIFLAIAGAEEACDLPQRAARVIVLAKIADNNSTDLVHRMSGLMMRDWAIQPLSDSGECIKVLPALPKNLLAKRPPGEGDAGNGQTTPA